MRVGVVIWEVVDMTGCGNLGLQRAKPSRRETF